MSKATMWLLVAIACAQPALAQDLQVPSQLSLADALKLADERNPRIQAARQFVVAAQADRLTAGQRANPALSVDSAGYPLFGGSQSGFWDNQELTVRFDQEVRLGSQRSLRIAAAAAGITVAEGAAADERRHVELEVRRTYYQVVLAKADRDVARTALGDIDSVISLNRARFDQGEISGAELRRVQVERLRFADDVFTADLALRNAKAALLALLGITNLGQDFEPTEVLVPPAGSQPLAQPASLAAAVSQPAAALSRAFMTRPDLQAASASVVRADTETRLQRALRTPSITLGGGYRRDFGDSGVVFGGTIPLPFFNRNQGGIARADAERRAAEQQAQATRAQVSLEVQQALNAVDINRQRVEYIEREYLKNAQESRDIVLASYRLGTADLIDFLDAQRAYRDTVRTYNRALFDQRLSVFDLQAAVGEPSLSK